MHHPIRISEGQNRHDVIPNSRHALERLAAAGADAILYGHLHTPHALFEIESGFQMPRSMLCIMAGTATSSRLRLEWKQTYNRIWFDGDRCVVDVYAYDGVAFVRKLQSEFVRDESGWSKA
jgi:predicted phosphodiesterase